MTQEEGYSGHYYNVHSWLVRTYGNAQYCQMDKAHKAKRFEWANVSGDYLKDINDYMQLCPSCHRKMDYKEGQRELVRKANIGLRKYGKKIAQLLPNGVLIKVYDAVRDAESDTGILHSAIQNVLAGRAKTAGGFIWVRKN